MPERRIAMQPNLPQLPETAAALPFAAPVEPNRRLLLYCLRRMGAHGLNDAHAANAMLGAFGIAYRRPLVMLRVFVQETAHMAQRKISITGCCCMRMTFDEARLIDAIATAMGTEQSLGALCAAQAVQAAFADLGRRLD
jgi:ABC-type transporter Mla maintaining outer membrane lipid asymmetry permease subunit MlaE